MTTLRFDIPVDKIPVLATAAILAGEDLGSWAAGETRDRLMARTQEIPGEEVAADGLYKSINLDDLVAQQANEEPPVSDFFADIV
jgi:hypothetical protein